MNAASELKLWAVALLLALGTAGLYWPATTHAFINFYDDPLYVTENPHVVKGLVWENVSYAFHTFDMGNWNPMTWFSHMLDCQLFGLNSRAHHLMNVLWHTVNTVLVFWLFRMLTGAVWRSALVALLFGVHPLHVESVAWVAERKDLLSGFFGLLTLIFYASYVSRQAVTAKFIKVRKERVAVERPFYRASQYWLALACFALGLMSKPMLVTWPFVLLLLDFWPLNRLGNEGKVLVGAVFKRRVLEKIPFLLLTLGFCVVTMVSQKVEGAIQTAQKLGLGARLGNAVVSYGRYLWKLFWPVDMAVIYPHPGHWPVEQVGWAIGVLLVGTTLFLVFWRKQPALLMGWFWFLGTLVPVIGLVQVGGQAMADRYTYLPSLGIFLAVVWGGYALIPHGKLYAGLFCFLSLIVVSACSAVTVYQLKYWKDTESLFRHTRAVTQKNYVASNNLACEMFMNGRYDEAIPLFEEAIQASPGYVEARNNLGNSHLMKAQFIPAIGQFQEALRYEPGNAQAQANLVISIQANEEWKRACRQLPQPLSERISLALAHRSLGLILIQKGLAKESVFHLRKALGLDPSQIQAHGYLGFVLLNAGKNEEAIREFKEEIRINPGNEEAWNDLGVAYGNQGRLDEAAAHYLEALRLSPDFYLARNNLGNIFLKLGRLAEAIVQYREVLRNHPDNIEAKQSLELAQKNYSATKR